MTTTNPILEPEAQKVADLTAKPPFLYELGPEGARKVLDDIQAAPIEKPEVAEEWITVPAEVGHVQVRIVKPVDAPAVLPVVLYVHGGGWIWAMPAPTIGSCASSPWAPRPRSPSSNTTARLRPTIPSRSSRRTRRRATSSHRAREGPRCEPPRRRRRLGRRQHGRGAGDPREAARRRALRAPVTLLTVTDAAQDSASYREFADGPFLTAKAMAWFWDAYLPQRDQRGDITASPLRASREQLAGLPPALVIVDENDVLRDEGEAYARQLIQAGVPTTSVRYNAIIHDFMMLNPVRATQAATAAIEQAILALRKALGT